jgi:carbamoyl-phosphate synthase small subunit
MTYPQIGNYGCQPEADESERCWASAMVMRQLSPCTSSWTATMSLEKYLLERDVMAMDGVDTRELTLLLRSKGALRAVISTETDDADALLEIARAHPPLDDRDLTAEVSCRKPYTWSEGLPDMESWEAGGLLPGARKLVCLDLGIKRNILRNLVSTGFDPVVVPADTDAAGILAHSPDAVFLSNGPGDPAAVKPAIATVRELVETGIPVFGICLGHQILALALGGRTFKMKFGHHGANHPVLEPSSGRIDISSQNHGFVVDPDSLADTGLEVTHLNGNDRTVAGLKHCSKPVFSVQYHPEGAPGPHDPQHLFRRFFALAAGPAVS